MKAVINLIKVNGIIVDSLIKFEQTVTLNERWKKQTLDDVTHREISSVKEKLSCCFSPRTILAGDVLWQELCAPNEVTVVEYPSTSTTTAIKEMMITTIKRELVKSINGVNYYGDITVTFSER